MEEHKQFVFEKRIEKYIEAAIVFLEHKGKERYADVLRQARHELDLATGYDNWDGGQYSHTLRLTVPFAMFEDIADELPYCSQSLRETINLVSNEVKNESLEEVGIAPDVDAVLKKIGKITKGMYIKTAFDEYEIGNVLGEGGNGRVFSARNAAGEEVAIKFLERESSEKRKRFRNEVKFCENCAHENIVKVLDRGYAEINGGDRIFCVMPLYAESLRTKMARGISPEEAVSVFIGLMKALGAAHLHGVIHRDVKPENIMFASGSIEPILCDFGIARIPEDFQETFVVTQPASRLANFQYAAPEQKSGNARNVGLQADLYAAGLILNEMFTHEVPASQGYKKISEVAPSYAFLDAVVESLFQQDPSRRPRSAEDVLTDLKVRMENNRNSIAIRDLSNVVEVAPARKLVLSVVNKTYSNSRLLFEFNDDIPQEWLSILNRGSFSHTSMMGCETSSVARKNAKTLSIPVDDWDDENVVRQKVKYFLDWVGIVNTHYNEALEAHERHERHRREEERKREIARLESENRMRNLIARL